MLDDEKTYLESFRKKIVFTDNIAPSELIEFANKYEDLMEMAKISLKMLDSMVKKHQRQYAR